MSVTDTGWYTEPPPSGPINLRDQIVWPPGWELPAVTENVILDVAMTVTTSGETIAGYMNAGGERWILRTSATWSHRVGFIPGTAAGSYNIGDTVPMYRHPRFIAAKRTARGTNSPTFFNPNNLPNFPGLSERVDFFSRTGNVGRLQTTAITGLVVGQTITVSGIQDTSFNGSFIVTAITSGALVFFTNVGPNVGSTFCPTGRVAIPQADVIRRMHQLGGLRSWARTTGPAPSSPSSELAPITVPLTWIYRGVHLQQILIMGEPYDFLRNFAEGTGASMYRTARVWAPVAAEICRDFAVNATLPAYGQIRVVWVDGIPQCSFPTGSTAPYVGCTRLNRQRGHTDRVTMRNNVALFATLPEDGGRVRSLTGIGTPFLDSPAGGSGVRPDLFGTMWLRPSNPPSTVSAFPFSSITVTGQWMRTRSNGAAITFGTSFSIAYSILTLAPSDYLAPNDNSIPAPLDATYGNTPGLFFLRVTYAWVAAGSPLGLTSDYYFAGSGTEGINMRSSAFVPKLVPWPYDVPKMAFAADDASVQYVGHPGWLMPSCVYPVNTIAPPSLSRAGTTITATAGSCAVAPAADGLVAGARAVMVRAVAQAVNVGGTSGNGGTSGTLGVTVAAFSGQSVDAQADDVWSVAGSHVGGYGPSENFSGKVIQNLP